ncbi:hypothetical protein M0D70_04890 [Acinetobacter portensis]|uniref:FUSC family protein n=2 Tax=Acinetobacter TaxID=469 RepID=A0A6L6GDW9_9GAMM|nr:MULTISPECIES: hypothetical protein [Acinetobacter]MBP8063483.1 hypothetical protein [Acinetobacter sp.]MCK7608729.1 hypothetical protein [Acinetobacter portensis]MCK7639505.1 hypothetical protein [Acinetobacter portensis]MDY6458358.1 hypothetical protein [Acinetobacter faecalis]MDY6461272.1 hypothetical protein [Acinetobacter faecalis]
MSKLIENSSNPNLHPNYAFSELHFENKYLELKDNLERKSHTLIVFLGACIGGILSLFISYHLNATFYFLIFLCLLPIGFAYILRKVYINTLVKID